MKKVASGLFLVLVFLSLNGLDYVNLGDIFRQGKMRWMLFALVPIFFIYLEERLHWAAAMVGALALFSWTTNNYQITATIPLVQILGCLFLACAVRGLPKETFVRLLLFTGAVQSLLAIFQVFGFHFLFTPANLDDMHLAVGTLGHKTILGPLLICCLAPALWEKRWRLSMLMLVGALLTRSTMTYAALACLLLVFVWHRYSFRLAARVAAGAGIVLILSYALFPNFIGFNLNGRGVMWHYGYLAAQQHPWFGMGLASWRWYYIPQYGKDLMRIFVTSLPLQLHNDALDFAIEYGAAGLFLMLAALYQFIRSFRPTWENALCAAVLVNGLGNFPLAMIPIALVFLVSLSYARDESEGRYAGKG